jgi:hypothetical protein
MTQDDEFTLVCEAGDTDGRPAETKLLSRSGKVYKVLAATVPSMFRRLSPEDEREFIAWARSHADHEIRAIYHPVIQNEMFLIRQNRASLQGQTHGNDNAE